VELRVTTHAHLHTLKTHLTKFRNFLDKYSSEHFHQLKLRASKLESYFSEFEELQEQIEIIDEGDSQNKERDEFENNYYELLAEAEVKLNAKDTYACTAEVKTETHMKLPTINLPTFAGNFENWLLFKDSFESNVHNNVSLNAIQKFQYLRSCLKGEALMVISSLSISSDNYNIAWNLILNRYHNEKVMINNHIKAIFNLQTIGRENHRDMRCLLDNALCHTRALKVLGQPVDQWDSLLIHIIHSKLDNSTSREWETYAVKISNLPTFAELISFLEQRCEVLENIHSNSQSKFTQIQKPVINNDKYNKSKYQTNTHLTTKKQCPLCKRPHGLFKCFHLLNKTIAQRIQTVKELKICANCLTGAHSSEECKFGSCSKCGQNHNTLLHETTADMGSQNGNISTELTVTSVNMHTQRAMHSVLLSTAVVKIKNYAGDLQNIRVLLDSGSESNFITKRACNILGIQTNKIQLPVAGIGNKVTHISEQIETTIYSTCNDYNVKLTFLVIPSITDNLPIVNVNLNNFRLPSTIALADPNFNKSASVDMLIGAEIFYDLLCIGQINPRTLIVACEAQQIRFSAIFHDRLRIIMHALMPTQFSVVRAWW